MFFNHVLALSFLNPFQSIRNQSGNIRIVGVGLKHMYSSLADPFVKYVAVQ